MKPHRPREDHSSDVSYQFCKIFLQQISGLIMPIPPAFVRKLKGNMPNRAKVRDHTGKMWNVCLEEDEEEGAIFMSNGWPAFATAHCLEHGDYLRFKYDGKSLFDVEIFSANGCRKERAEAPKRSTTAVEKKKQTSKPQIEQGMPSQNPSTLRVPEALEAASKFSSEHPFFKIVLWESYLLHNNLTVPFMFAMNLIKDIASTLIRPSEQILTLQAANRSWPVKFTVYPHRRLSKISTGWMNFVLENDLKAEDVCIFELINSDAGVLKVSIFRRAG